MLETRWRSIRVCYNGKNARGCVSGVDLRLRARASTSRVRLRDQGLATGREKREVESEEAPPTPWPSAPQTRGGQWNKSSRPPPGCHQQAGLRWLPAPQSPRPCHCAKRAAHICQSLSHSLTLSHFHLSLSLSLAGALGACGAPKLQQRRMCILCS
jgi:hypothetical protein